MKYNLKKWLAVALAASLGVGSLPANSLQASAAETSLAADSIETADGYDLAEEEIPVSEEQVAENAVSSEAQEGETVGDSEKDASDAAGQDSEDDEADELSAAQEENDDLLDAVEIEESGAQEEEGVVEETTVSEEADNLMAALNSFEEVEVVEVEEEKEVESTWINEASEGAIREEDLKKDVSVNEEIASGGSYTLTQNTDATVLKRDSSDTMTVVYDDGTAAEVVTDTADVLNTAVNIGGTLYVDTLEKAATEVRNDLKARADAISILYRTKGSGSSTMHNTVFYEACKHTGVSTEGDYLIWQVGGFGTTQRSFYYNGYTYYTIIYSGITYYTSAAQEKAMTTAVKKTLTALNLKSTDSDYTIIKKIYDYICKNVKYDTAHYTNPYYTLQFSAYAALVNKTAVCQGYSLLFYRLALEKGIDARLIGGTSQRQPHAWNIVLLNGKYYNLDSTWDAGVTTYKYFLKCNKNFTDHTRDGKTGSYYNYTTAAFNKAYPMSTTDFTTTDTKAPAKPKISSLKNTATQKMVVKWGKVTAATGYQIQYGTSSSFSGAKTTTITKNTTVQKTYTKLTKKKTYYVRMRTYKTVNKKKVYSSWSAKKSVKITK